MRLDRLSLQNFRCYESLDQTFEAATTIIDGFNGSGKTALIEAIYWQSTGRSFRNHKSSDLIQNNHKQLSVYSEYVGTNAHHRQKLGVSYSTQNKKTIKYNGERIQRQTDIAQKFPVIAIDPGCFLWVDHPPGFRRSFLDWLVFHVEPQYLNQWKQTQKVHQHLNKLLKQGYTDELLLWQQRYAQLAEQTHIFRTQVVKDIQDRFKQLVQLFLPGISNIHIMYNKGWGEEDLMAVLARKQDHHLRQGFIDIGVHKSDLICLVDQQSAQIFLSRGQKKLIAILMYIIFIEIYEDKHVQSPVICLDDIDSELDNRALQLLSEYLQNKPRQLFITAVLAQSLQDYFINPEVFHVKQSDQNNTILYT